MRSSSLVGRRRGIPGLGYEPGTMGSKPNGLNDLFVAHSLCEGMMGRALSRGAKGLRVTITSIASLAEKDTMGDES